ncbi:hypothetical protein C900_03822 [Fulvivirga imtechensis AK7]|uniref:Glycosyltransferase 2-like domain-containing protein n=1 Tax=Fulvivirga imtechensis AK7 TaxID=1237149 RepID=L8JRZ0_9BACT|nr:glycosyltransferase family 2 protein [Fulvivirga imtechensis]ELR70137.1 hypothetical protein C900_03822 [Fulvivirga imtechensis AK7]
MKAEVSVVIPTRNRPGSVRDLLADLSKQTYPLKEVIIVDSSDQKMDGKLLNEQFPILKIRYMQSQPSVCIQRNLGILKATSPYIFLCDDDISIGESYLSILMAHLQKSGAGAASGLIMQYENGKWCHEYPPTSFGKLLFAFAFQHSIWGNIDHIPVSFWQRPFYFLLRRYYHRRGNSISKAGWPVLTEFKAPVSKATIYGLGASVIKKEWLLHSPYDEVLDAHGIGDNYGVAINFPGAKPIEVVTAAEAYHLQSTDNRLEGATTYYRRLLALGYFLKKYPRFNWWNRVWFCWSLAGNLVLFRSRRAHRDATYKVLGAVLVGKNPYWMGFGEGKKVVEAE